jgi:hypothetical protein
LFCSKCGTQLSEGSAFCSRCGASVAPVIGQVQPMGDVSPKSRLATTLLAAFLGGFGAHRFYMGKIGTAVVMLLLGVAPIICGGGMVLAAVTSDYEAESPPVVFWVFYGLAYLFGFAVGIWVLVDFIIAVTGNFKDSKGKPIKKW